MEQFLIECPSLDDIKFTLTKDRKTLYAFVENFQEKKLVIKGINAVGKEPIQCFGSMKNWDGKTKNQI